MKNAYKPKIEGKLLLEKENFYHFYLTYNRRRSFISEKFTIFKHSSPHRGQIGDNPNQLIPHLVNSFIPITRRNNSPNFNHSRLGTINSFDYDEFFNFPEILSLIRESILIYESFRFL